MLLKWDMVLGFALAFVRVCFKCIEESCLEFLEFHFTSQIIALACLPTLVYWVMCAVCMLHPRHVRVNGPSLVNSVRPAEVILSVLALTVSNAGLNAALGAASGVFGGSSPMQVRWEFLLLGVWLVDTIEFVCHVVMHKVPWLFQTMHKTHHALHQPYAFGALYNATPEAVSTGALVLLGFLALRFSFAEFSLVTAAAYAKTVVDHAFDDSFHAHHHARNMQSNFQQPFFTYYDHLFSTYEKPQPHPQPLPQPRLSS